MLHLPAPHADTPTLQEVRDLLQSLTPERSPDWGTMNATEMVKHCADFGRLYLGEVEVSRPIRWAARLIGPLFLRKVLRGSPKATPKNLRTLGPIKAAGATSEESLVEWEQAHASFTRAADALQALSDDYRHPLYGPMRSGDVLALFCHHTAHHLHQFGLL